MTPHPPASYPGPADEHLRLRCSRRGREDSVRTGVPDRLGPEQSRIVQPGRTADFGSVNGGSNPPPGASARPCGRGAAWTALLLMAARRVAQPTVPARAGTALYGGGLR